MHYIFVLVLKFRTQPSIILDLDKKICFLPLILHFIFEWLLIGHTFFVFKECEVITTSVFYLNEDLVKSVKNSAAYEDLVSGR